MENLLQKSELVHMAWKIAQKDVPGLKKVHIEAILDGLITSMSDALFAGRSVPLGKICTISVKEYPPKTVEDKNTGKTRELPPRKMLYVTTGKSMLAQLNGKNNEKPNNKAAHRANAQNGGSDAQHVANGQNAGSDAKEEGQ